MKQTLINKKDENKIRNFIECFKKDDGFIDAFSKNIDSNYLLHVKNKAVFKGVLPKDFVDRILNLTPNELLRVRSILKNKYECDDGKGHYVDDNNFFEDSCNMLRDKIKQSKKDKIVLHHVGWLLIEMQEILLNHLKNDVI